MPQANLLELVRLEGARVEERIKTLNGTRIFQYRGRLLPIVSLRSILGNGEAERRRDELSVAVLHADGRGLVVDQIHDPQEIVVKPLAPQLKVLTCYIGATIMGDGLPALILDVAGLARLAGIQRPNGRSARAEAAGPRKMEVPTQMLLLFAAGRWERLAVLLSLVARLEEVRSQRIEQWRDWTGSSRKRLGSWCDEKGDLHGNLRQIASSLSKRMLRGGILCWEVQRQ